MLQPIKVDAPSIFPHACVQCHGQAGPLVDTHVEDRFGSRVYVCASCVRLDAISLGLLDGKEHSSLLAAAEHESETAKALARMTRQRDKAADQLKQTKAIVDEQRTTIDWMEGRIAQLEVALRQDAQARLAVVEAQ